MCSNMSTMLVRVLVIGLILNSQLHVTAGDEETSASTAGDNPELTQIDYNQTMPRQGGYGLTTDQQFFPDPTAVQDGDPGAQNDPQKPKKRRRRRRKPKAGVNQYGLYPGPANGEPVQPPLNYGYQGAPAYPQIYSPPYGLVRPPRVRQGAGALSALSNALGSIAKYDDNQCVPRLLCEVASGKDIGGGSAGGGSGGGGGAAGSLLPAFLNLQPLITLLAAYNGMTSSPLFVFGRAALLGMTSQGNSASCRYAYPLCPNDPDKLLDYLNNHNGGFFRFFSGAPDSQQNYGFNGQHSPGYQQQGLQQFYNHLANIPLNQYDQGAQNQYPAYYNPQVAIPSNQYNQVGTAAENQFLQDSQQNYGIYNQDTQDLQGNYHQNYGIYNKKEKYGQKYKYGNNIRFKNSITDEVVKENKIEKRIQNSPAKFVNRELENEQSVFFSKYTGDTNSAWSFPGYQNQINEPVYADSTRTGKILKFPQIAETVTPKPNRVAKGFAFPGSQSNRNYKEYYNYPPLISPQEFPLKTGTGDLKFDSSNQEFVNFGPGGPNFVGDEEYYADDADGEVIYILRGDGDPNNPEVVKLRPGQNYIES